MCMDRMEKSGYPQKPQSPVRPKCLGWDVRRVHLPARRAGGSGRGTRTRKGTWNRVLCFRKRVATSSETEGNLDGFGRTNCTSTPDTHSGLAVPSPPRPPRPEHLAEMSRLRKKPLGRGTTRREFLATRVPSPAPPRWASSSRRGPGVATALGKGRRRRSVGFGGALSPMGTETVPIL